MVEPVETLQSKAECLELEDELKVNLSNFCRSNVPGVSC